MATNLEIAGGLKRTEKGPVDIHYGPWDSLVEAKAGVPSAVREGKTIGVYIEGVLTEYWWPTTAISDDDLIVKLSGGGSGITAVVEDTSPQLGGDLDTNGNDIVTSNDLEISSSTSLTLKNGDTALVILPEQITLSGNDSTSDNYASLGVVANNGSLPSITIDLSPGGLFILNEEGLTKDNNPPAVGWILGHTENGLDYIDPSTIGGGGDFIPLSGTTVGNEITGSLNLVDASNIRIHSSSDTSVMTTNIGSGSIKVQLPADPYSMTVDPENITIEFDGESTNISGNAIATTANDITIATGGDGIKEAVDYSANYTALSLVNKGFVESKVNSGEWTPTLTTDFDSAALNVAYYQKIGNMVLFQISFIISTAVATTGVVSFSAVPDIEIDNSSAINVTGVWSSRQGNILDSTGNIKLLQNLGEIVFAMDTGGVPSIGTYRFEISGSYKTI